MNRIVLIGNGFDRAHELPTSYEQFIADYWETTIKAIRKGKINKLFDNKLVQFNLILHEYYKPGVNNNMTNEHVITEHCKYSRQGIESEISRNSQGFHSIKEVDFKILNKFFDKICSHLDDCKWVDIENNYYKMLKDISQINSRNIHDLALNLNKELAEVEYLLKEYLIKVESKTKIEENITSEISKKIYSPFYLKEFSYTNKIKLITDRSKKIFDILPQTGGNILANNYSPYLNQIKAIYKQLPINNAYYDDKYIFETLYNWCRLKSLNDKIEYIESESDPRRKYLLLSLFSSNETLLLDFNYTNTTSLYAGGHPDTEIIHIHGELNNPKNPMIFGYGDEIGEDYQKIENLEENELLKNVKSIRYQDTNNYQRLMEYIESDYYQVFVMGHSCGNSDRTLLNTLFEHENCLSIKPFFHQSGENDENNNYSDIVRNISRNFRDKPSMRNKVVNKTYCESLLEFKKSKT